MLRTIVSSEILVRTKEVGVERVAADGFRGYWERWELHLMLVLSLSFQFLLVISGHVRKRNNGGVFPLVSGIVYLTYLLAELTATITLSALLRAKVTSHNSLVLLWTPFLLWHLGGPYNVTAYSIEDTEIWTRHLVGFIIRVTEALYICFNSGVHTHPPALRFIVVPILVAGIIKYAERIWALWTASENQLADHLSFGRPYVIKGIEWGDTEKMRLYLQQPKHEEVKFLRKAYLSFMIFRPLFFGFPARFSTGNAKYENPRYAISNLEILKAAIIDEKKPASNLENTFKVLGIELALLYDTLYTKFPIQTREWSVFAHTLYFLVIIASLVAFSTVTVRQQHQYGTADIFLTYLLLLGAILLECLSAAMHLFSTWSMVKLDEKLISSLPLLTTRLRSIFAGRRDLSMGQHDLIEQYCFRRSAAYPMRSLTTFLSLNNTLRILWNSTWVVVDVDLKEYIYHHLTESKDFAYLLQESSKVAETILQRHHLNLDQLLHVRGPVEFVDFIFVFHIATNVLYHMDIQKYEVSDHLAEGCRRMRMLSKRLSDYMMYLALVRRLMLPKGMADVVYKDILCQLKVTHITSSPSKETTIEFTNKLYDPNFTGDHIRVQKDMRFVISKLIYSEVLDKAVDRMAKNLRPQANVPPSQGNSSPSPDFDAHKQRWDTIFSVWADMLAYAAVHCAWKEHAQQLKEGGELLTYVALLMAHLGIPE